MFETVYSELAQKYVASHYFQCAMSQHLKVH